MSNQKQILPYHWRLLKCCLHIAFIYFVDVFHYVGDADLIHLLCWFMAAVLLVAIWIVVQFVNVYDLNTIDSFQFVLHAASLISAHYKYFWYEWAQINCVTGAYVCVCVCEAVSFLLNFFLSLLSCRAFVFSSIKINWKIKISSKNLITLNVHYSGRRMIEQ